jgi:AAA family ATP:ADP antiporter
MLVTVLQRVVPVRQGEALPMLLATAYGFCILFGYYVLRPVRDEISAADRGNLQLLWSAVFLVMLVAVPLYSAVVSRMSRAAFVPLINRFFALNLIAFFAALALLPESARPWIDRVFYVWVSVFALFAVTVFWGLVADLFHSEQGKRLFGFIAVGSSLGGIAGSATTALLAPHLPVFLLLPLAVVPLEAAAWLARALDRRANRAPGTLNRELEPRLGGSAWSGIGPVFRSPLLRQIALWLLLMTFASTVLYFVQAHLVGEAFADRGLRRAFLAKVDFAVNAITIATQVLLTAHILRRIGIGLTLAVLPAVALAGFVVLGAWPQLAALVAVRVLYDSSRHALAKPAREVLFTLVSREQRYKSKAFIDAAVYRGGDLASGWIYAGLASIGLSAGAIALVAAPFAGLWVAIALRLGRTESTAPDRA